MTEATVGREPVQIIEIQQPLCSRTYGVAPCTATGAAGEECFNTRSTCQDPDNFALDATPLSLYFDDGREAKPSDSIYIMPFLQSVSTSPTVLNLAGQGRNTTSLGNRATCTISFNDPPHTDRIVDPYLSNRSYDPFSRGSFWSKWNVRNRYGKLGATVIIYEGYDGQALSAMTSRQFQIESLQGPTSDGQVTIRCKDILARIEDRKAKAPLLSPGELYTGITSGALSIEVAGATTSDYPATGTLRINDELMTYSARSTNGDGRLDFTISARGTDNTSAAAHDAEDAVQYCLRFDGVRVESVIETLLTSDATFTYAGIPASFIPSADWTTEADSYLQSFNMSALLTEPIAVAELVAELCEQAQLNIWWDERDKEIKLRAVRGVTGVPDLWTDETNIVAGSVNIQEMPSERVSQVYYYYNQSDPTEGLKTRKNYKETLVTADLEKETDELYGEAAIREIFGRWTNAGGIALSTSSKIITRYSETPRNISFQTDAKDRSKWTGDTIRISHFLDVDENGAKRIRSWTITSAEEVEPGHLIAYTAQDTELYGRIYVILEAAAGDYVGDGTDQFNGAWIGDASGVLSNGDACARIS